MHFWSYLQSGSGSHHTGNEEVLWRQSVLFPTALSEQVWHTICFLLSHKSPLVMLLSSPQLLSVVTTSFPHPTSSGTSTTLVVSYQAPSKWTAVLCSSTRSSSPHYQTSRPEEVSFTQTNVGIIGCSVVMVIVSFESWTESVLQCIRQKTQNKTIEPLSIQSLPFFIAAILTSFCICRFLSLPENLSVSAAGLHLRRLVSAWSVVQLYLRILAHPLQADVFPSLCPFDRCCLYRPVSVFRCWLVCAYVKVNVVYRCFTQLRHVFGWFYLWF